MKIGQEGDKRRFKRPYLYDVTKDVAEPPTKWPKCEFCGLELKGKKFRLAEGKYVCFRCSNE